PISRAMSIAIGVVTDLGVTEKMTVSLKPAHFANSTPLLTPITPPLQLQLQSVSYIFLMYSTVYREDRLKQQQQDRAIDQSIGRRHNTFHKGFQKQVTNR